MPYEGERGAATPRLPEAGWLPDPSRTDLERYWDGRGWTSRTRDRVSKLERVPAPNYAAMVAQPQRRRGTRPWAKWALGAIVVGAIAFAIASYKGTLPEEVPYSDTLTRSQPAQAQVAYPVFGSDDLVTYLAAAMVAQETHIDVSYWMDVEDVTFDGVKDALQEAATQNPYVFASSWSIDSRGTVMPTYTYDAPTAEGRRVLTAQAVGQAMGDPGVMAATTAAEKVAAIHAYIAGTATYDYAAYDLIGAGATPETTPVVAESQQAFGILVAHTAVCNGYAQAFQLLAQAAGVESVIVTGQASGLTTGGHAWNEVLVGDEWLVVDVTWDDDDVNGVVHTDYLMVPTNDPVLASRSMDTDWVLDANIGRYGI